MFFFLLEDAFMQPNDFQNTYTFNVVAIFTYYILIMNKCIDLQFLSLLSSMRDN